MSDINIGAITESLNDKADLDLRNIDTTKTDVVIEYQSPTSENDYRWYRLYASGWVEQGGRVQSTSTDYGEQTVIFPITMADIGYTVTVTPESSYNNTMEAKGFSFSHPTTTSMRLYPQTQSLTWGNYWKVEGRADMTGHEVLPQVAEQQAFEHRVIAFRTPTAANNYTWFRKYEDGWIEQGIMAHDRSVSNTWTFPIEMASAYYDVSITNMAVNGIRFAGEVNRNTTNLTYNAADDSTLNNDGLFTISIRGMWTQGE